MKKKSYFKLNLADLGIALSVFIIILITIDLLAWQNDRKVIESDVVSYYAYLPSTFIYQDLSMKYVDEVDKSVKERIYYETTKDGKRVIKMTMGVSYFYLPFFIFCNHLAPGFKYAPNGYTKPYRVAIVLSSIFFFFLGLVFIKKILLKYYDSKTAFWTILIVGAGTNLVNYTTREVGMSHVYSFAAVSALVYFLDKWYTLKQNKDLFLMSFVFGLIVLIRPTNAILFVLILLYGIDATSKLKERVKFFKVNWKSILSAVFIFFIPIIPQLLYWKYATGHWAFYSYTSNEGFFFDDPKIIDGLFSYKKGWLLYTPLMSLTLIGLLLPIKKMKKFRWSIIAFFVVFLYITFSWWCWYYGGSFGMRVMIDHYAIFSVPIAGVLYFLLKQNVIVKFIGLAIISALIYVNQFQNYQYREGFLHYSGMNKKTYWMMFMNASTVTKEYYDALDEDDIEAQKSGKR